MDTLLIIHIAIACVAVGASIVAIVKQLRTKETEGRAEKIRDAAASMAGALSCVIQGVEGHRWRTATKGTEDDVALDIHTTLRTFQGVEVSRVFDRMVQEVLTLDEEQRSKARDLAQYARNTYGAESLAANALDATIQASEAREAREAREAAARAAAAAQALAREAFNDADD